MTQVRAQPAFDYTWERTFTAPGPGRYRIPVPEALYGRLQEDYEDLMIYRKTDLMKAPFLWYNPFRLAEPARLPVTNTSEREGLYYYTVQPDRTRPLYGLEIRFAPGNFVYQATAEGSSDGGITWFRLDSTQQLTGILKPGIQYQYGLITFPASTFPLIRIRLGGAAQKPVLTGIISHTQAVSTGITGGKRYPLDNQQSGFDRQKGLQYLYGSLSHAIPAHRIVLKVSHPDPYRRQALLQIPADTVRKAGQPDRIFWQAIAGTTLTPEGENELLFSPFLLRQFRVQIAHLNNAPFAAAQMQVWGPDQEIRVLIPAAGEWTLAYGNPLAAALAFDRSGLETGFPDSTAVLHLSEEKRMVAAPEKSPAIKTGWLYALLGIMVIGLGIFGLKLLREAPGHRENDL